MNPPTKSENPVMIAWYKLPGLVYFFKAGNAIKIGVATVSLGKTFQDAVNRRMRQIQSANHEPVELLGAILFPPECGDQPTRLAEILETELHERFVSLMRFKRYTVGAEWFTSSDALLSYIRENAQTPEDIGVRPMIATMAT